ncbi:type II toxin-antitoxin system Phd/YefM family antitoxin [Panacagrimonas sp.]|uniref:type II toxin-antitoxin system Phd/YefM family antitoxin n=1 Tax=Panacagrimonas sp. TaxID=2480088 RepID=UPI003B52008B
MEVGAYEAKTHLPRLLERVARGERITITKHGKPIAELIPAGRPDLEQQRNAWSDLMALREDLKARGMGASRAEILSWIEEGRR